jgi:hypothetical protein
MLDNVPYFNRAVRPEIDKAFSEQQISLDATQILRISEFIVNEYVTERRMAS